MSTKRSLSIISACMCIDGTATFASTEVAVEQEEAENGVHYDLVEAELLNRGYEEPFVHFDADDLPPAIHAAVREYLGATSASEPVLQAS